MCPGGTDARLDTMTTPADSRAAVLTGLNRLSDDVTDLSARLARVGAEVDSLTALLRSGAAPTPAAPMPPPVPTAPPHVPADPIAAGPNTVFSGMNTMVTPAFAGTAFPCSVPTGVGHQARPFPQGPAAGYPAPGFRPPGGVGAFAGGQPIGPAGHPAPARSTMPPMPAYGAPHYPAPPVVPLSERLSAAFDRGLVGRILAGLGVGVTLIGVVLLLVLAAQAGWLGPGLRVAGGGVLAAALVGGGLWLSGRPGYRTGAISLCATGVGAAYLDVLAATVIYRWLPEPVGLVVCGVIGGAGLALAHRWSSEALGLLVMVPLMVLAPIITGGFDLVTACFMLALSAAGLLTQIDHDWVGLFTARVVATSATLTGVLVTNADDLRVDGMSAWLYPVAGLLGVVLAFGGALLALRRTGLGAQYAVAAALSLVPFAVAGGSTQSAPVAICLLGCAAVLLVVVYTAPGLPGVTPAVRQIWLAASATAVFAAATMLLGGPALAVTVLAVAVVCAVAAPVLGDTGKAVLFIATAFGTLGALSFLNADRLAALVVNDQLDGPRQSWEPLYAIVLGTAAIAIGHGYQRLTDRESARIMWCFSGFVAVAAITDLCVSVGVLVDPDAGFRAGHVAATIVWMTTAAVLLGYTRRRPGASAATGNVPASAATGNVPASAATGNVPTSAAFGSADGPLRALTLTAGLILVAAAVAKLFLFDLAALDGVFRVIVFIVSGLMILTLGSVYAKSLTTMTRPGDRHAHAP
jgi:hypothetical protein